MDRRGEAFSLLVPLSAISGRGLNSPMSWRTMVGAALDTRAREKYRAADDRAGRVSISLNSRYRDPFGRIGAVDPSASHLGVLKWPGRHRARGSANEFAEKDEG